MDLQKCAAERKPIIERTQSESAFQAARSTRRQHLVRHLFECGPRAVFEALLEVEAGKPLDEVLTAFDRIPASVFSALDADVLPIDQITIIEGGTG